VKVALCCPTVERPFDAFVASGLAEVPLLEAAGIEHQTVFEVGCPYISHARSRMLRKALDWKPDAVVFLDHDLSWKPGDLLKLIQTKGDVIAGTYRLKKDEEEYMGRLVVKDGYPVVRDDGCIRADWVPGGFLKVTAEAVDTFMRAYPDLVYGTAWNPAVDLFNHGAHQGVWWGEDYAFSRRWNELGGEIWFVPDLDLTHHAADGRAFPGNLHRALLAPEPAEA
jgi:glycosyltransferase involved in cell wall biosynthesis